MIVVICKIDAHCRPLIGSDMLSVKVLLPKTFSDL